MLKNLFRKNDNPPSSDEFKLVCKLIRDILPKDKSNITLNPETKLLEIGFDSIKYIQLLLNLENIVDKDIETIVSNVELSEIQNVEDVVRLVKKLK
jgi:acyl carrier protein